MTARVLPVEDPASSSRSNRWELVRALGAMALVASPESDPLSVALGLPAWSRVEHTGAFVLGLPPYSSIYLGPEGKLGGEGADRVAGVWRALGLAPPADADHLSSILALYAELGEASDAAGTQAARTRLDHVRATVLWEHLLSWTPVYLEALGGTDPIAAPWARLLWRALGREAELTDPAAVLPLALRAAPEPLRIGAPYADLLDALVAPVRVGFVLTHKDLSTASSTLGVGLRRGERRYVLDAVLRQDITGGLSWLAEHARLSSEGHLRRHPEDGRTSQWWSERARQAAGVLDEAARAVNENWAQAR